MYFDRGIVGPDSFRGNTRYAANSSANAFKDQLRRCTEAHIGAFGEILRDTIVRHSIGRVTANFFRHFLSHY